MAGRSAWVYRRGLRRDRWGIVCSRPPLHGALAGRGLQGARRSEEGSKFRCDQESSQRRQRPVGTAAGSARWGGCTPKPSVRGQPQAARAQHRVGGRSAGPCAVAWPPRGGAGTGGLGPGGRCCWGMRRLWASGSRSPGSLQSAWGRSALGAAKWGIGAGFTVLKCQRPGSGSGLGSGRASGEMGVSGARSEPTSAPPAPGRCPGHSHPHQAPRDPPTSPGRLGNGSYQATAKGAGAQPRSLDSSPTHSCPAPGGQGTGGRPGDLGQVSSPALAWGRGPVTWGPARDCPPAGSPSRAGCLCFSPCVCAPPSPSLHLPLLRLAGSIFPFLCFSSPLPPSVSRPVCFAISVSVPPTPPPLPPPLWGPLPHPPHTFQPPPPSGCPSLGPAAAALGAQDGGSGLRLGQRSACRLGP